MGISQPAFSKRVRKAMNPLQKKLDTARLRKWEAQADNEESKRDESRRVLVEASRVLDVLDKVETMKIARERSAYVVELPAKLGGQPADRIAAAYEAMLNEIHEEYQKQFRLLSGI